MNKNQIEFIDKQYGILQLCGRSGSGLFPAFTSSKICHRLYQIALINRDYACPRTPDCYQLPVRFAQLSNLLHIRLSCVANTATAYCGSTTLQKIYSTHIQAHIKRRFEFGEPLDLIPVHHSRVGCSSYIFPY